MVIAVVVESFGGIVTRAQCALKFAARRAGDKKRGRDGTKYSRTRPASFLTHHMRQISSVASRTRTSRRSSSASRYHRLRVARERARDELISPRARRGAPSSVGGLACCHVVVLTRFPAYQPWGVSSEICNLERTATRQVRRSAPGKLHHVPHN